VYGIGKKKPLENLGSRIVLIGKTSSVKVYSIYGRQKGMKKNLDSNFSGDQAGGGNWGSTIFSNTNMHMGVPRRDGKGGEGEHPSKDQRTTGSRSVKYGRNYTLWFQCIKGA